MEKDSSTDLPNRQNSNNHRSFFEATLESIKDCVCVFSPDHRLVYANQAMQELMGGIDSMRGINNEDFHIQPEFGEHVNPYIDSVFQTGKTIEDTVPFPIGAGAYLSFTWSALPAEDGSIAFVMGAARDTKEISELNEVLLQKEAYYQGRIAELHAMLESISDAVYIGNAEGITLANQRALDQLGFTTREELNRQIEILAAETNIRDTETGEVIPAEQQPFSRALAGDRVTQEILVRHRLTGEERIIRCAASPVIHEGRIIAAVAINTDVTEHREADIFLRESQQCQAFLLKISDALRSLSDPVAVQEIASRLLGEQLQVERTYYVLINEPSQKAIVEREYLRNESKSLIGQHRLADFEVLINVIRIGKTLVADDVMTMPELEPQLENFLALNLRALVAIPLIKNGELVAVLTVANSTPRAWTKNEILMLEETAERTWAAVERARAEKSLRESGERQNFLLKLSDALRPLSDSVAIQETTTRLLGEHLGVDRTYYSWTDEARQVAIIERDYVRNGSMSLAGEHRLSDFVSIMQMIDTGKVFIANDVVEMPEVQPQLENYLSIGLRALLCAPLIKGGHMVAALAITNSTPRAWTMNEILLLEETAERTWAAVERARAETALQDSQRLLASIFDSLPVGVGVFKNDGSLSLGNKEVQRYLPNGKMPSTDKDRNWRWRAWDEQGKQIEPLNFPGARAKRGEYVLPGIEMLYTGDDGHEVWTQVIAVPFKNKAGAITGQVTVVSDIDRIKRTTEALLESEVQFHTFVAASSDLIYRMSPDWQEMYTLSGKGFLVDTQLPSDKWMNVYIPEEEQVRVVGAIKEAMDGKKMFQLDHRVILANGDIGWVNSRAVQVLNKKGEIKEWLGAASDITLRKKTEEQLLGFTSRLEQEVNERTLQLKESRDQLQSIFDITLMQMTVLEAVRNENGEVVDIEIKMINKEHERVMGRTDLVGKYYVQEYPGMKKSVLFNLIVKTIETGEPQQAEYYYPYEGFNRWYSCMFVKFNDGVVSVNMDISARKQAEEERFKNYLLLQQSEDLALLGSWDFDLSTGAFTWSDGMYRLFNLEKGTGVTPEIYLRYTTATGRPAAERVVRHLKEGDTDFAETLELDIAGQIKIMHLKATVVRNDNSEPVRVLGVDKDITASRRADEKIRRMEAEQQQEIFRVTLASQEEERRRISESLHNGLGQLLYAIKISMTRLTPEQAADKSQAYIQAKKYTDELLKDAIVESRRISHELMPSILEDFGLKAAIEDVCSQLSINVKFNCMVTGFVGRLDSYMELAIFRTMQELMLNVVKHSGATEAIAEASINTDEVLIKVQDNGRGMLNSGERKAGIGLASIRSKVKLLNGQIKIDSVPGQGTAVTVQMPLSSAKN
jgi:PAS domain S-box-containing protein